MEGRRMVPLALGASAVSSGLAMLTFDILFSISLSRNSSPIKANIVAIVSSALGGISVGLLSTLLCRQLRYRNGTHIQDSGHGRHHTYLLARFSGVFGILSGVSSAVLLGIMKNRIVELPKRTIHSSTKSLVTGAFIVWAISLLFQAMFIICMVIIQRRDFQQEIRQYRPESQPQSFPEMQESALPRTSSVREQFGHRGSVSMDSRSPPSSSGRSRAGSDTMSSFRSSLSNVVRPMTSKTRLVHQQQRSPYRHSSLDAGYRERSRSVEDGFDSWDTSAVDAQSRQAVESASPTPPRFLEQTRFLETIPASPTASRSPSPGFPLDLQPPKARKRSRSYSPANSHRDLPRTSSRNISPTESMSEAHIHPLFRTDSPTPPPAATPGTVVTAAPGAGQVISDRASIRSLHRMRSESLPSSPLAHSDSLESIRRAMEKEEWDRLQEAAKRRDGATGERTLTPPIPDYILNSGSRNSIVGYHTRRKAQSGVASPEMREE